MIGNYNNLRKIDIFVKILVSARPPGASVL